MKQPAAMRATFTLVAGWIIATPRPSDAGKPLCDPIFWGAEWSHWVNIAETIYQAVGREAPALVGAGNLDHRLQMPDQQTW